MKLFKFCWKVVMTLYRNCVYEVILDEALASQLSLNKKKKTEVIKQNNPPSSKYKSM